MYYLVCHIHSYIAYTALQWLAPQDDFSSHELVVLTDYISHKYTGAFLDVGMDTNFCTRKLAVVHRATRLWEVRLEATLG